MKTRFVAEVSSNHARDLGRCSEFIETSARIGCDAVKFQQFKISELFDPIALKHNPHLLERKAWELPASFNRELADRSHANCIDFSSTPFYMDAVGELEPHVDFFKIASYQVLWLDLLHEVAQTGREVVLATGMANMTEVQTAVEVLYAGGCGPLTLLHCVSLYPTPTEEANLCAIETMRQAFGSEEASYGWSDHSVSSEVIQRAVGRFGASMVEFHMDLDGRGAEYAAGHCWLPAEIEEVIQSVKRDPSQGLWQGHLACDGDGVKQPRQAETLERQWRTDPSDGLRPLLATRQAMLEQAESRLSA